MLDLATKAGSRARDRHASPTRSTSPRPGLVARRQVDRGVRDRREGVHERRARPGVAGGGPPRPVSFLANVVRELDRVEPRRHVPALRHRPAHRARPARARRSHAAHAEVPRGSLPRSVHASPRRPAIPATVHGTRAPRTPTNPDRTPDANPGTRRTAREPVTPVFDGIRERLTLLPLGLDVERRRDQPRRQDRGRHRDRRRASRISTRTRSTSSRPIGPVRAAVDDDGRAAKSSPQFTPDSKEVYYLDGGPHQHRRRSIAATRGRSA